MRAAGSARRREARCRLRSPPRWRLPRRASPAQALRCAAPGQSAAPACPIWPRPTSRSRVLPIGGYTLAMTWARNSAAAAVTPAARFQCGGGNRFGFTLHGLWPDGVGKDWPQYCAATPRAAASDGHAQSCARRRRRNCSSTNGPSTAPACGLTPAGYFAQVERLYARAALSRHGRAVARRR